MEEIIIGKLNRIEAKLDAVIKALHEYDGNDEYGESSFEAFQLTNEYLSSLNEKAAAQYNEKIHHVTNEEADEDAFDDYGQRVVDRDKDNNNNTQGNERVGEKKRNKRKYYKPKNK
jgi:hypothetical protein